MLRLGSFLLALWAIPAFAQTIQPTGGGGGAPSSITIPTPTTGCATANGVFFNSSNTLACANGFTTTGTEAAVASGTQTASLPILALTQTWNNGAIDFTGVRIATTVTAASGLSAPLRIFAGAAGATKIFEIRSDGLVASALSYTNTAATFQIGSTSFVLPSTGSLVWGNAVSGFGTNDLLVTRVTTGVAKIASNGASAGAIVTDPKTVTNLPAAATAGAGARAFVTDATACTFGGAITGGGSTPCPVYSTGSAWLGG